MRTVRRLRLRFLLLRPSSPNPTVFTLPCCPLCYSLPCRNHDWPFIKKLISDLIASNTSSVTSLFVVTSAGSISQTQIVFVTPSCSAVILIFIQFPYGGPGGSRTRVQNTFLFASYSNNLQYIFIWRCGQSLWR